MYQRQCAGRQQQAPPRKRRLVTYYMQPLNEQAGYTGPRQDGHRFGVNRILRLRDDESGGGAGGLISAGRDGVVRRWDITTLIKRAEAAKQAGRAEAGAGTERSHIFFDGLDNKRVHPLHQPPLCTCTGILASHTDWVTGLAAAEGRILASSSNDGTLKLWDLAATAEQTGDDTSDAEDMGIVGDRERHEAHAGDRGGVANGRDGTRMGGALENGGLANNNNTNSTSRRRNTSSSRGPLLPRPKPLATVAGHGDYVKCLTYAPEGGVLVSGGLDKRILLWDLQRMTAPLMTLRIDQEDDGGGARAMDVVEGVGGGGGGGRGEREGYEENAAWLHLRDPSKVVMRPGVAAAGPNEVLELCRQNKGSVYCLDTSVDASLVASGGTDRMIRLLDPRAGVGRAAKVCKLDGHRDNVRCVRIDEGGTRVVSGSTDGTIRVWDVRQQNCLGVYELPGGSVWAMQASPCDFDVYYSGGRGRRIYRTDFRTGESSLICITNAEVLDMSMELGQSQQLSMWLSSTEPEITLWGGPAGGGDVLQSGKPQTRVSAVAAARRKRAAAAAAAVGGRGAVAVEPAPPYDHDLDTPTMVWDEEGECVLSGPVAVIPGQPGVVRHVLLNNRRQVLTEDNATPPNVALWDVTKAKQVEIFPVGTIMEEKERALTEIIAVRPWFTVDTHLGTPMVSLSENSAFDGELYAVDANGERQTLLEQPQQQQQSEAGAMVAAPASNASCEVSAVTGGGSRAHGPAVTRRAAEGGGGRVAKPRSVQDEVKVNLGEAVLRSLFGCWIEQQHRLEDGRAGPAYRSRRGLGGGGGGGRSGSGRHLDNGVSYSSGDSEDEDSEQDDRGSGDDSRSGVSHGSRTSSSEGSGLGVAGGGGGVGGVQNAGDHTDAAGGQAGSGSLRGTHGLDLDLSGRRVGRPAGSRALGDDTVLWVIETDLGGNGGIQRTLLQKRVGEFDGTEGEDMIPHWVTACVLHGEFRAKEQPKVSFYLAPWIPPESSSNPLPSASNSRGGGQQSSSGKRGSGSSGEAGSAAARGAAGREGGTAADAGVLNNPGCQRFTAHAQMLVSKIMAYVLSDPAYRQHLETTGTHRDAEREGSEDGEGTKAPNLPPEELVEVLCGDLVMEPHLYVGAIQQYIWNPSAGGTLFLHYRSPSRTCDEG